MAQIDFSNAVIEPKSGQKPLSQASYGLYNSSARQCYITDGAGNALVSGDSITLTLQTQTPTKFSVIGMGTISYYTGQTGVEMYLGYGLASSYAYWKISNISFVDGDTFAFQLDFDLTVS